MHYVPFVFKRGHLMTVKMLQPLAARHGLTPARFDILNLLLLRNFGPQVFPRQGCIARALGLCRTTICKMVKALVKAGLVTCSVDWWDRRCRRLKLTPYGRRCVLAILKVIRVRTLDRLLLRAIDPRQPLRAPRRAGLFALATNAWRLSRGLGDEADHYLYRHPSLLDSHNTRAQKAEMRRHIDRVMLSEASLRHYRPADFAWMLET